ncbi:MULTISPECIES: hypothetical protein [unclassified Staphylococcus]|uniref:hypothetical protein n=1 Tax=unclassified Staphylococcus TaxID=91994 RepID=UPI0010114493|nr:MULTISPECIES: hypothetical protein [unclassified Staphylococcus]MBL0377879.1 hypothetical protein [Staphylococcus sp. S75]MBL0383830.1 hypothetical protein [Staphylococcus sp. S59]MBL0401872.1 hypothetical protein [Staphylococcus sp. S36]RXZ28109.1 hypothetical protein ESM34_07080 [Staphylococcus sp. SNAZ 59]RXZ32970.1 hypothetical protein ESM33_10755 [Staphylococcus sp. SNAZ 36]
MKKLLMILVSITLIAVIGVAGVFGYSSIKGLMNSKENNKTEVSKKDEKKDQKEESNNDEEVQQQEQVTTEIENNNGEENKELNLEDEIAKADKNGDGIATTDEMTPELEKLADQGLFQPMSPEMANPENHKEYEEDEDSSSEDEDMSEAYERQKEMYEKQARGEAPQPGEGPITEE